MLKLELPIPQNYQKLWLESPRTNQQIDQPSACIFCQQPLTPRRITLVVQKQEIQKQEIQKQEIQKQEDLTEQKTPTHQISPEVSCPSCAQQIRAYTPSPHRQLARWNSMNESLVYRATPRSRPNMKREKSWSFGVERSKLKTIEEEQVYTLSKVEKINRRASGHRSSLSSTQIKSHSNRI